MYEAYRAHEEGKTIVIARASNRRSHLIPKPLIDPKKTQENSRSELGFTVASVQQGLGEWGLGPLFASPKFCVNPVRIYVEVSGLGAPLKNSKALTLNYEGAKL